MGKWQWLKKQLGHTSKSRTWKAEAGGSLWIWRQPNLYNKFKESKNYIERPCFKKIKQRRTGKKRRRRKEINSLCITAFLNELWACSLFFWSVSLLTSSLLPSLFSSCFCSSYSSSLLFLLLHIFLPPFLQSAVLFLWLSVYLYILYGFSIHSHNNPGTTGTACVMARRQFGAQRRVSNLKSVRAGNDLWFIFKFVFFQS